jgi:hypothetical protein
MKYLSFFTWYPNPKDKAAVQNTTDIVLFAILTFITKLEKPLFEDFHIIHVLQLNLKLQDKLLSLFRHLKFELFPLGLIWPKKDCFILLLVVLTLVTNTWLGFRWQLFVSYNVLIDNVMTESSKVIYFLEEVTYLKLIYFKFTAIYDIFTCFCRVLVQLFIAYV